MMKVAINGFGRIGRSVFRILDGKNDINLVAINDIFDKEALTERNPESLPWKEMDVDIVIESTGIFRLKSQLEKHLDAGAKRVILTVPSKDEIDYTVVLGVNDDGPLNP